MSSQPRCSCGVYVHHGPVLCEECIVKVERQLAVAQAPVHQTVYPCGCITCVCEGEERCYGCGAKNCGQPGAVADHVPGGQPMRVRELVAKLAKAQGHVRNHHLEPCVSCAANESERDALNAEVERLAEGRCTGHATAPAVDGCGVCVRQNLVSAIEILREVEAQWGEEYLWSKYGLSKAIAALTAWKEAGG